ncbi:MAG: hypothetical protein ACAI35_05830, partial [Candidatus Methylacidiphilales bacterium]|nr:hypothetical protein [Candidatus Methylacidiphilales bacterium]
AFQENLTRLRAKLDAEKKFEGRTFWLPSYTFQQILRDRADLMAAPAAPATPATNQPPVPPFAPSPSPAATEPASPR